MPAAPARLVLALARVAGLGSSLLFLAAGPAAAQRPTEASTIAEAPTISLVRDYLAAYNRHDVLGMIGFLTDDFIWYRVTADSLTTEIRGTAALTPWLEQYFRSVPSARSEAEDFTATDAFVAFRETAIWQAAEGEHRQRSVAIFEMRGQRIRRAWYFPAER